MIDVWLIIVTIVCFLLMVALNIFVIFYYLHPDDKGFINGCFEKFLIIMASTVLWAFVLLLPLDIANSRGEGSGFSIETAYVILFIIYLVFLTFILPFVSFFYDTDSENSCGVRFFKSLIYTVLMLVIVVILGLIAWGIVNNAKINVSQKVAHISGLQYKDEQTTPAMVQATYSVDSSQPYQPNVLLIAVIFILYLGWFILIILGGIVLIELTMDLIIDYVHR